MSEKKDYVEASSKKKKVDKSEPKVPFEVEETVINPPVSVQPPVREKREAVVSSTPQVAKKGVVSRLAEQTLGKGVLRNIGDYILHDILIPNVRDILYNSVTGALGMAIYKDSYTHDTRSSRRPVGRGGSRTNTGQRTNYNDINRNPRRVRSSGPTEHLIDIPEYALNDIYEAREVVRKMQRDIDLYSSVSVATYYDYIKVESSFTDDAYGWYDLTGVQYRNTRQGVVIDFPPADVL